MSNIDYDAKIEQTLREIEELTQRICDKLDQMAERQEKINSDVKQVNEALRPIASP